MRATRRHADGIVYEVRGSGEPMLLVHGTASWRGVWEPVAPALRKRHRLILVDLPGHGESADPAPDVAPTPIGYAAALADLLDELGVERVHVAGNSVGGWTALELGKLGRARSIAAVAPAGLWPERNSRWAYGSLWLTRRMTRALAGVALPILRNRVGRTLLMGRDFGRPWRVPGDAAVAAADAFATTRGFDEHLRQTSGARFRDGQRIDVPVTVMYGDREHLIPKRSRRREELPEQTRWLDLPGCGHIPFWDDPELVAREIAATAAASPSRQAQEAPTLSRS